MTLHTLLLSTLFSAVAGMHSTNFHLYFNSTNTASLIGYIQEDSGPMYLQGGGDWPPLSTQDHFQFEDNHCSSMCELLMTNHNADPLVLVPVPGTNDYQFYGEAASSSNVQVLFTLDVNNTKILHPTLADNTKLYVYSVMTSSNLMAAYMTTDEIQYPMEVRRN